MNPIPSIPILSRAGDTLIAPASSAYQWYVDGKQIIGATAQVLLPVRAGLYTVRVFNAHGCSAISDPLDFRIEQVATAEIFLPTMEVAPGERFTVPLLLQSSQNLDAVGATAFNAELKFKNDLLQPIGNTPTGVLQGNERIIPIQGYRNGSTGTLTELEFMALLSDEDSTPIRIDSFAWNTGSVRTNSIDGEVKILLCREGGPRLFSSHGKVQLAQNHPNPFNTMTQLTFELIETGLTKLVILDALGREQALLFNRIASPGRYTISYDAGERTSGLYYAVLQTPSQSRIILMRLIK